MDGPEATRDRLERERAQDPSAGTGSPSTGTLNLWTTQVPFPGAGSRARPRSGASPRHPQDPHPAAYLHPSLRPAASPRPRYRESPGPTPPPGASRTRLRPAETAGGRARGPPKGRASPGCCILATSPIRRLALGSGDRAPGPRLPSEWGTGPSTPFPKPAATPAGKDHLPHSRLIFTFIIVNSLLSLYILFKKYIRYKSQKGSSLNYIYWWIYRPVWKRWANRKAQLDQCAQQQQQQQ